MSTRYEVASGLEGNRQYDEYARKDYAEKCYLRRLGEAKVGEYVVLDTYEGSDNDAWDLVDYKGEYKK